jgi:hypothetical protein
MSTSFRLAQENRGRIAASKYSWSGRFKKKQKKNGGNFWFVCLLIVESSGMDEDWGGGERYGISGY